MKWLYGCGRDLDVLITQRVLWTTLTGVGPDSNDNNPTKQKARVLV